MTGTDIEKLETILRSRPGDRHEIIPLLQEAQAAFGYLPPEVLRRVAEHVNVPPSRVYGVATFYAQFRLAPPGRHNVKVCRGTACHVRGSGEIMAGLERHLDIKAGGTTKDSRITLERVACVGSCALAPAVITNGKVFARMTSDKTLKLLDQLK
jgi:NADH-quinone oxidoreductase subunit E